ncbi:MAG: L-iditol 2-dehydrogenase [Clostridiales bacterium]|nr:L-iditol 2-dehydrogenase [Clostridiales bacterium]MDK2933242.1 L-iditol 2-dehydrogenase [Clostridiales bacterium]
MRAALIDKPFSVKFTHVSEPMITKANEVKIQTFVTGICGSEVHAFHGTHPFRIPPLVSGHEVAGVIIEVGSDVKDYKVGDRVTVEPHYGCGLCNLCKEGRYNICSQKLVLGAKDWSGSFGEFFVVPEQTVIKLPDNLSFEKGVLIEPIAVGMHAVRQSGLSVGQTVAIIGTGPIGLGVMLSAKMAGASKIIMTDALDFNLEVAQKMGCKYTINALKEDVFRKVLEITDGKGVDVTYIAFGNESTFADALKITKRGGAISEIAIVGVPVKIPISTLQLNEIRLYGSNMYTRIDFEIVRDAIANGDFDVEPLISKIMPIEEVEKAMKIVDKKLENVIKVLLKF